jgi:hypothetical protein
VVAAALLGSLCRLLLPAAVLVVPLLPFFALDALARERVFQDPGLLRFELRVMLVSLMAGF